MKTTTPLQLSLPRTRIDQQGIYRWMPGSAAAKLRLLASVATSIGVLARPTTVLVTGIANAHDQAWRRKRAQAKAEETLLTDQGRS